MAILTPLVGLPVHVLSHVARPSLLLLVLLLLAFSGVAHAFVQARSLQSLPQLGIQLAALKTPASDTRSKTASRLMEWADQVGIKLGGVTIQQSPGEGSLAGLGIIANQDLASGNLVLTVPSNVALLIESPGDGPDDGHVLSIAGRRTLGELPWYAQFAVYLYKLDKVNSKKNNKIEMKPWLDSLPRAFDTPIHWSESQRDDLQYAFLEDSITRQQQLWESFYQKVKSANPSSLNKMDFCDFLWGCEVARSRAFSGAYTGSAFNPFIYGLTLILVLLYVGLGFGTLEQAANGAGLVFCAQVLKDIVLPKVYYKTKFKRYIIPVIDMANHASLGMTGEVSFEFFGDAYSLAVCNGASVSNGKELFISYGARSNDQLLQYYGFVERNNPHDVYIMPSLRDWNIAALEEVCGRTFAPGRLRKLDRAGLLGSSNNGTLRSDLTDMEEVSNSAGGVVVTRAGGVDPAVMQALRALVSTDAEWEAAGEAIGNFVEKYSSGQENERLARLAAKTALQIELESKPTTLDQDEKLLNQLDQVKSMDSISAGKLALIFRIEKKKLLNETILRLSES